MTDNPYRIPTLNGEVPREDEWGRQKWRASLLLATWVRIPPSPLLGGEHGLFPPVTDPRIHRQATLPM